MKVNIISKWMTYNPTQKNAVQRFVMEYLTNNINVCLSSMRDR